MGGEINSHMLLLQWRINENGMEGISCRSNSIQYICIEAINYACPKLNARLFVCHIYEMCCEYSTLQWKYIILVNQDLFRATMFPIESNERDIICTVRCRFSAVDLHQTPCFGHPIAHSCGPDIGCLMRYCELKLWFVFFYSHCTAVCNILSY